MTTPGYSRAVVDGAGSREPAAILSVDPVTRTAKAVTRSQYTVTVNTSYAVGDMIITPVEGEQWYIERFDQEWRLASRIPFNDPTMNIEAEPGQVSVGSAKGPLELNGTEIRINNPFRLGVTLFSTHPTTGKLQYSLNEGETWIPLGSGGGTGGGAESTDELPEGAVNKYFTNARAAAAAPVQTVAGRAGAVVLTKSDVGLSNVDNVSDINKPISSAVATALNAKADLVSGKVPALQLPPRLVLQYDTFGEMPVPGASATLYIAADTGNLYWWSGSNYELLVSGVGTLSNADELPEGAVNKYYTDARAAAAAPIQADDVRLTNQRTPVDASVTTAKIADDAVTLAKLDPAVRSAIAATPYDVSYPQTIGPRTVGLGQNSVGVRLARAVTFNQVVYRCGTADASGASSFELRKNGSPVPGTQVTVAAAGQVSGGVASGSWSFAVGDILTVAVTAVGTTPGVGLVADIRGDA